MLPEVNDYPACDAIAESRSQEPRIWIRSTNSNNAESCLHVQDPHNALCPPRSGSVRIIPNPITSWDSQWNA